MAAISTTVLALARSGDHVVMLDELYGGTHAFATDTFDRFGIRYSFAATDADAVLRCLPETKVIVIESPTNPLLGILDIRRVAEFARNRGIATIIDNTFATPMNQNPIGLGIDVVVHSGTKYMGGHSDLCCGIALTSQITERMRAMARHLGGSLNAITCYLLERSLKTLALRVERQTANAGRIAEFLASHGSVRSVNYPGLPDFKGHGIARSQMRGFGGMLSFELEGQCAGCFLQTSGTDHAGGKPWRRGDADLLSRTDIALQNLRGGEKENWDHRFLVAALRGDRKRRRSD